MYSSALQLLADALSTLTILSCLFLKVPQIMSIREKRSADGIYIQAMLMEITGFTVTTLYNFTNGYGLLTYMEYPIILIQIYVMLYYTLKFKGLLEEKIVTIATLTYWGIVFCFINQILTKDILSFFIPFCTPLSGFAKVTYIYGIIKAHNADAVSLVTWLISVTTNIARIFTVYVDSADTNLLTNFSVSTLLSLAVLCTAFSYKLAATQHKRKINIKGNEQKLQ